jgi:hypothetical protein
MWTDILYLSGGKLELSKCTYHALQFKFQANGTPIAQRHTTYEPLPLQDPISNATCNVPYLPAAHAHKILGHWKLPADNRQLTQLNAIMAKANKMSLLITISPLSREGAMLAYRSKYLPSIRYVLPQCWFPASKLNQSERLSMARLVAKCGFARTTPRALIYAPRDYAGAGFVRWATIQGEGQIQHFIKHWRTESVVSKMLRINLSWAQWQSGQSSSILWDVTSPLPHVEGRWILSLRQSLAATKGALQLDTDFIPPTERKGDHYLMDMAIESGAFNTKELQYLNYCRV